VKKVVYVLAAIALAAIALRLLGFMVGLGEYAVMAAVGLFLAAYYLVRKASGPGPDEGGGSGSS